MKVAVLTISDGREEVHARSLESLKAAFPGEPSCHIEIEDPSHDLGFAGAIAEGWRRVSETDADFVFHVEADFLFSAPVPIAAMAEVLLAHPWLAQVALKRQPWNEAEKEAGGIVECWPDEYRQRTYRGNLFTTHRLFWTTNPALYPIGWTRQGWPQSAGSEVKWTDRLKEDPDCQFAFWGGKFDPPAVEHIGTERAGTGY